ncbi:MAG: type II toxin-antitoxin system RelE/ParE family toxin [Acidobacteriaceae bacterium]
MAWQIEYDASARKDLTRLDKEVARRITALMRERVARLDDPRSTGQALKGSALGDLWRYRVGDYRIVCDIQGKKIVVLVLRIGHRREVYR